MTRAQLNVYIYGLYLVFGISLPFMVIPHFTLGLFGLSAGDDMWIRFFGLLAGIIGGFYIAVVLSRIARALGWTVPARYATAAFMGLMVTLGKTGPALLIFAGLDAITASLTWVAIRAGEEEAAAQTEPPGPGR